MIQAKLFFESSLSGGGSKIPVGIHEGTVMFDQLVTEGTWADIRFSDTSGRTIHKRLFQPAGSNPKNGETPVDARQREEDKNVQQLVYVMRQLLGDEATASVNAQTYDEFVTKSAMMLNNQHGVKVNLKVVPDWREGRWPDLPLYRFLELHEAGKPTTMSFTPKEKLAIEKMAAQMDKSSETLGGDLV